MTKETEKRAAELGALFQSLMPEQSIHATAGDVADVRTAAATLQRLAVKDCNVGLTARDEKRRDRLAASICQIVEPYGFRADYHGDPRSAVVKLFDPADERAGDGFGGGWAIY